MLSTGSIESTTLIAARECSRFYGVPMQIEALGGVIISPFP